MNCTLIGMKSIDEGKQDIVCTICRVLTSKFSSLQPGSVIEMAMWYYFGYIANEFTNRVYCQCGDLDSSLTIVQSVDTTPGDAHR